MFEKVKKKKKTGKKMWRKNYEMGYPKSFNFGFTVILTWSFFSLLTVQYREIRWNIRYYGYDMWV